MVLDPRAKMNSKSVVLKELGRYLVYASLVYLTADFVKWSASVDNAEAKFSEYSFVEYAQSLLLLVSALISLKSYISKHAHAYKNVVLFLAGLSAMALIREQDIYFEQFLGDGMWPLPVFAVICVVAYKAFKSRRTLWAELALYVKSKSFAFFSFATITIFIFSRLFGRTTFWKVIMEDQYFRSVKNVAEESLELYGYLFFLFAVVELIILIREKKIFIRDL